MLRIGEVTGRPVLLLRPEPIARGDYFEWGPEPWRARGTSLTESASMTAGG